MHTKAVLKPAVVLLAGAAFAASPVFFDTTSLTFGPAQAQAQSAKAEAASGGAAGGDGPSSTAEESSGGAAGGDGPSATAEAASGGAAGGDGPSSTAEEASDGKAGGDGPGATGAAASSGSGAPSSAASGTAGDSETTAAAPQVRTAAEEIERLSQLAPAALQSEVQAMGPENRDVLKETCEPVSAAPDGYAAEVVAVCSAVSQSGGKKTN